MKLERLKEMADPTLALSLENLYEIYRALPNLIAAVEALSRLMKALTQIPGTDLHPAVDNVRAALKPFEE